MYVWSGFLSAFLPLLVVWGSPPWFHVFHILTIFIWLHILHCVAALNRVSFHYAIFLFCLFIGEMIVLPVTFGERMTIYRNYKSGGFSSLAPPTPRRCLSLTMLKWIPESPPQNRKCCCQPRYSNSLRSPAPGPGRAMTSKHLFSHLTTTPLDVFPSGSKGSLSKITTSIADLGSGSAF